MNVIKDFRNNLLKRRELQIIESFPSNPGYQESMKFICSNFDAKEENIVIYQIKSKFGRETFLIDCFIYDSVADKEKTEPKKKVKDKGGAK